MISTSIMLAAGAGACASGLAAALGVRLWLLRFEQRFGQIEKRMVIVSSQMDELTELSRDLGRMRPDIEWLANEYVVDRAIAMVQNDFDEDAPGPITDPGPCLRRH
ncbi:hypothetical protein EV663_10579 [Rhodovulum bhavnagarense]|uniref:Uncharacterized protein n=1 Tax=Rhodovulum bhavnagarense TaxID=992286 RepID=A0A4R2RNI8_9RHOB|nr:hypothetical protein [Rhodovulum bhavnagarense]TCP61361.1 hypothetical protein EV663_10579 [Rhodovulum bhavnagarense]